MLYYSCLRMVVYYNYLAAIFCLAKAKRQNWYAKAMLSEDEWTRTGQCESLVRSYSYGLHYID